MTTGELLNSLSSITSGTALQHLQNITAGGGGGYGPIDIVLGHSPSGVTLVNLSPSFSLGFSTSFTSISLSSSTINLVLESQEIDL